MTHFKHRSICLALLITLGVVWGSGYSIARYCMTHGVPPLGYSFWQSLGPMIFLLLIVLFGRIPFSFKKASLRYYVMCGVLGIALPNTLIYFAAQHLPSGVLTVLVNTVPILIYPLALGLRQEGWQWQRVLAVAVGVIGIMLIIGQNLNLPSIHHIPWTALTLFAPLSFAFCAVLIALFRPTPSNSMSLSLGMLMVSTACILPLTLGFHSFYPLHFPFGINDWLIMLEILLSSLGYFVLFVLIKLAGPVYYSMVGGVVSLTGLFWGKMVFHEQLNFLSWGGVAAILLAIALLTHYIYRHNEVTA